MQFATHLPLRFLHSAGRWVDRNYPHASNQPRGGGGQETAMGKHKHSHRVREGRAAAAAVPTPPPTGVESRGKRSGRWMAGLVLGPALCSAAGYFAMMGWLNKDVATPGARVVVGDGVSGPSDMVWVPGGA